MKPDPRSSSAPRRIVITAANGFLGRGLVEWFSEKGDEVVALVRRRVEGLNVKQVVWDGENLGPWTTELEGATAVINLAGRSVDCRYHEQNRRLILESRLRSTRVLGQAIAACRQPPAVWLNSSSATIYRHAEDRSMDEAAGEIGKGFSVDVCLAWEAEVMAAETPVTRRVLLRTAMVLGRNGGVFQPFKWLARLGLGGTLANGRHYMSWLHETDFARAIDWLIRHPELNGAVNLAAPNPIFNAEWMRLFRRRFGPGIGLPAARWMLAVGAFFLRTETELLLKSRRVVPGRLLGSGFKFRFPTVEAALEDLTKAPVSQSGTGALTDPSK
jgi:uncharacterized protein (TIGR01777 family)